MFYNELAVYILLYLFFKVRMLLNQVFICMSVLLTVGFAFPNGSTSGPSCGTMKPKHGKHAASEETSPFRIFVEGPVVRSIRNTEERFAGRGPLPSAVQGMQPTNHSYLHKSKF